MSNRTTCFLLLYLTLFLSVSSFGRRKTVRGRLFDDQTCRPKIIDQSSDYSSEATVDPHCSCVLAGFGVIQKIPYMELSSSSNPIDVRFSSACVRCGMCLAIAGQINQTLLDLYDLTPLNTWLDNSKIILALRAVCNCSFTHYRLREIDGKRFICDRIPGAKLIATSTDHLWDENLRETCNGYLDEIGEVQLYKRWQQWLTGGEGMPDIATILCRGDGSTKRECNCIENVESFTFPSKSPRISVKISARYSRQ